MQPTAILSRHYALASADCELLESGSPNESWRVRTAPADLVLKRIVAPASAAWFRFQEALPSALERASVPAPRLVPARDARFTIHTEGSAWQLREFVDGRPFEQGRPGDRDEAARLLATLHSAEARSGASPSDVDLETLLEEPDAALERTLAVLVEGVDPAAWSDRAGAYRERIAGVGATLDLSSYRALPHALSHGEFHGNNILFSGDRVCALLDWDAVAVRPRVYDLARAAFFLSRRQRGGFEVDTEAAVRFVSVYLNGRALTGAEADAVIPILQAYFVPSARYLRLIRGHAPSMWSWYLDWSFRGGAAVEPEMTRVIEQLRGRGLVEAPASRTAQADPGQAVFERAEAAVKLIAEPRIAARIAVRLEPYIHRGSGGRLPADTWTVLVPSGPVQSGDGVEYFRCQPAGEPESVWAYDRAERRIWVLSPEDEPWLVQNAIRLVRVLLRLESIARGMTFVHGGMVAFGAVGVAFIGPKRAGKTSSILACLAGGADGYVSNDDLGIVRREHWMGVGWPRSISVRKDSLAALSAQHGRLAVDARDLAHPASRTLDALLSPEEEKHGLHFMLPSELSRRLGCQVEPEAKLCAIVVPAFSAEQGAPSLRRLTRDHAFDLLAPELVTNPGKHDEFLLPSFALAQRDELEARLTELLHEVPVHALVQSMASLRDGASLVRELARSLVRESRE